VSALRVQRLACDSLLSMPRRLDVTDVRSRGAAIAEAAAALRAGELVAFPTETVYGLGALARDEAAVTRLYAAKGRPRTHPLIVHLADQGEVGRWAEAVPAAAAVLAAAFWPGPLTLVLRARADVPASITGAQPTVALRVPDHDVARALLAAVGEGLVAPSANRFGRVSPTTAAHVLDEFGGAGGAPSPVALVLDAGPCRVGLESTIVDLSGDAPRLLRPGGVTRAALEEVLGADVAPPAAAAPRVPGSLARHYAPRVPARIVSAEALRHVPEGVGVIHRRGVPTDAERAWALPDDADGYARELYATLRRAEGAGVRELWIAEVPGGPGWTAIEDRLRRATAGAATEETP
jgi:L-threonylcarbamoyladenylate synthase